MPIQRQQQSHLRQASGKQSREPAGVGGGSSGRNACTVRRYDCS